MVSGEYEMVAVTGVHHRCAAKVQVCDWWGQAWELA